MAETATDPKRIVKAEPLPDYGLRLTYEGESPVIVDFSSTAHEGGIFAPLADPSFFRQVTVDERGRSICWPGDLDFCADALWLEAHNQAS